MEIQGVQYHLGVLPPPHLQVKSNTPAVLGMTPSYVEVRFRGRQPIEPLVENLTAALLEYFPWDGPANEFIPADHYADGDPPYFDIQMGADSPVSRHSVARIFAQKEDDLARIHMNGRIGLQNAENFLERYANGLEMLISKER